jgi:hypothetical protein
METSTGAVALRNSHKHALVDWFMGQKLMIENYTFSCIFALFSTEWLPLNALSQVVVTVARARFCIHRARFCSLDESAYLSLKLLTKLRTIVNFDSLYAACLLTSRALVYVIVS